MFYKAVVKYYDDYKNVEVPYGCFLEADSYAEAVGKLVHHYGNESEMQSLELTPFSDMGILETDDMRFFDYMVSELEKMERW